MSRLLVRRLQLMDVIHRLRRGGELVPASVGQQMELVNHSFKNHNLVYRQLVAAHVSGSAPMCPSEEEEEGEEGLLAAPLLRNASSLSASGADVSGGLGVENSWMLIKTASSSNVSRSAPKLLAFSALELVPSASQPLLT